MTDMTAAERVALVERFWGALNDRDFAAVGAMMSEQGHYIDVPLVGVEPGAYGPAQTEARLRLGIEPLSDYQLHPGTIVVTGETVITEHVEEWWWHDGEHAVVRFCSVMEVRDHKVDRWWDYVDLNSIFSVAPQWWTEHIANGYQAG
jgi:limonene-1,2-epoxide hydrolase